MLKVIYSQLSLLTGPQSYSIEIKERDSMLPFDSPFAIEVLSFCKGLPEDCLGKLQK
jgi:hypothetical protein